MLGLLSVLARVPRRRGDGITACRHSPAHTGSTMGKCFELARRRGRPVSLKVKIHTNGGLISAGLPIHQIGSIPRFPQNIRSRFVTTIHREWRAHVCLFGIPPRFTVSSNTTVPHR